MTNLSIKTLSAPGCGALSFADVEHSQSIGEAVFIAMNRFKVVPGSQADFEQVWTTRDTHLRDVPVFVAGGLGRGEAILSYLEMGASGAQLGTRFAASVESIAHEKFKKFFVHANARDAMPSVELDPRLPVLPGAANAGWFNTLKASSRRTNANRS